MRSLAAGLALGAALQAGTCMAQERSIVLRAPADTAVAWRGMPGDAGVGSAGAMMYPAPNLAGLLVAILTHSAIAEGTQASALTQQQRTADRVLEPYREGLSNWKQGALFDAAASHTRKAQVRVLPAGATPADGDWLVELTPNFALSQDHGTVVLDAAARITRAGEAKPRFENVVRVVSSPLRLAPPPVTMTADPAASAASTATAASAPVMPALATTPQQHWAFDQARAPKAETAAMLAHALEVALTQIEPPAGEETPYRTHRYLMGDNEAMERAQQLARGCGRVVLRTLRGTLLSAAVRPAAGEAVCEGRYVLPG